MTTLNPRHRISGLGTALLAVATTMLAGCLVEGDDVYENEPLPEAGGAGGEGGPGGNAGGSAGGDSGGPTWAEVEPVMIAKCGTCHGDPLAGGAPYGLITYTDAAAHAERSAIRAEQGTMPPPGSPPLTDDEVTLLRAWFEAGTPAGAGPVEPPRWADIQPILVARCGGCHGDPLSGGAPFPLIDYANASMHAERSAIRTESGTMPPQGLGFAPCTDAEVAQLRAWADAGAPE